MQRKKGEEGKMQPATATALAYQLINALLSASKAGPT